jgi:hypothetical protein
MNYHVSAFRVCRDEKTLTTLITTKDLPEKKLQLLCTATDATKDRGWSLVDKEERQRALQAMANIRSFILTE